MPQPKKGLIRLIVNLAVIFIIVFAFWWIFRKVKFSDLTADFVGFDFIWLLPALAIYMFGYLIRGYRWVVLLSPIKKCSYGSLFPTLLIGFMANNVLPARAGEFIRAHLNGKKENISRSASLGTILLERVFDGLAMLLILGGAVTLRHPSSNAFSQSIEGPAKLASILFGTVFLLFFAMILFKNRTIQVMDYLISHAPRKYQQPLEHISHAFLDGLRILRNAWESIQVLVTSLAAWTCEFSAYYLIGIGFHLSPEPVHFHSAALLMAITNLGLMVPSTPAGVGVFESVGGKLLSIYLIPDHTALAYIVTVHLLVFLPITLLGYYHLNKEGLTLKSIQAEKAKS